MKKIIITMLVLFLLPSVYSVELFTTDVNITIDSANRTVKLFGEEDSEFSTLTNVTATHKFRIYLYRETEFKDQLENLTDMCSGLDDLYYDHLVQKIDNINKTFSGQDYYEDYSKCFFSRESINSSLLKCNGEREDYLNESTLCKNTLESCERTRDQHRDDLTTCNNNLQTCNTEKNSKKGSNWVFGIFGLIIGAVLVFILNERKKPQKQHQHPVENLDIEI